jgi:hypothetical protein
MRRAPPDDATLLAGLLGPTDNLLVGFNEEAYRQEVGG